MAPDGMTAMSVAFERAGVSSASDRLSRLTAETWEKFPLPQQQTARIVYMTNALQSDRTCALLDRWFPHQLAGMVRRQLEYGSRNVAPATGGTGQSQADAQTRVARSVSNAGDDPAGGGHETPCTHVGCAPTEPLPPGTEARTKFVSSPTLASSAPLTDPVETRGSEPTGMTATPVEMASAAPTDPKRAYKLELDRKARLAHEAAINVEVRMLDEVRIDGVSIRLCTVNTVKTWIEARKTDARAAMRDVRFAQKLIGANAQSNRTIGELWPDDKAVNDLYAQAVTEGQTHVA